MPIPIPRAAWGTTTIEAGTSELRFNAEIVGLGTTLYVATLTPGGYQPDALAAHVASRVLAALRGGTGPDTLADDLAAGGTVTATIDTLGRLSIVVTKLDANAPTAIEVLDDSAPYDATAALLGLDGATAASSNAGTATLIGSTIVGVWTPDRPVAFDSLDLTDYALTQSVAAGGQSNTTRHGERTRRVVRFELITPEKTFTTREAGGALSLQSFIAGDGVGRFTWSPDRSSPTTNAAEYFLLEDTLKKFEPERHSAGLDRYSFELQLGAYES